MPRKLILLIIFILLLFVLLTPKQDAYFKRLADDYGEMHQSSVLTTEGLKNLGDYKYYNRLLYSHFEYQFGNISVSYFGFFTFIIFEKSEFKEPGKPLITV